MKVLVMESDPHAADHAIEQLGRAGHEVVRCHEPGLPAFPCNALMPDGSCALSDGALDVALLVRARPWPKPTPLEDGVSCALRHHLPLLVAGRTVLNPYEPWSTDVVDESSDIVAAVERAATAPLPRLGEELTRRVTEVLATAGYDADGVAVEARRTGHRRLSAIVTTAHRLDVDTVDAIVAAVHDAVRHIDPYAPGVDVEVHRARRRRRI